MSRQSARQRAAVCAIFLVAILPGIDRPACARSKERDAAAKEKDKPRLRLVVDPSVSFPPVTAVLTGQLTGVSPRDPDFCHAAVTWVRVDPGQTEDSPMKIREDPVCLHPPEETDVPTSVSRTFTLYNPGSYLFRVEIEGKNHPPVRSGYVKVEVLRPQ